MCSMEKHLIFIGGEAGVGKSTIARVLKERINPVVVIDKDEFTSVFVDELLTSNGHSKGDRESDYYLNTVKPLEYKQIDSMVWHSIESSSLIVTAPFFDCFFDEIWLERMKSLANFHAAKVSFLFITRHNYSIRLGLIERGAIRDGWKITNYTAYRKMIDPLIAAIRERNDIDFIDMDESINVDLVLKKFGI